MPVDILEILYSCIDEIGREKIKIEITSDIATSERYCQDIIARSKIKLGEEADEENLGTLCEALLHFLLTVSLLPSERKVSVMGANLDIVIPSVKILSSQPDKTLIIQIVKKSDECLNKIKQAETVQPFIRNIWIVSAHPLDIDHKNYQLSSGAVRYEKIISDIDRFLADKGVRGLKLLYGH